MCIGLLVRSAVTRQVTPTTDLQEVGDYSPGLQAGGGHVHHVHVAALHQGQELVSRDMLCCSLLFTPSSLSPTSHHQPRRARGSPTSR